MKKKFIKPLIVCIVVSVVLAGGYMGYKYFFKSNNTNVSTSRQITATAQKINMEVKIEGTGSVYAGTSKDITANNSGTLKDLNLKVGQTVTAGTKLFTVDSDTLRQSVTTATNSLKKQQLTLAEATSENQIAIDKIAVANAQTQLDAANVALNKMTVSSPINGMITAVNNTNGDSIQSGGAVATVADPASMKVKVSVDELNISKVKVGQTAKITFSALEGKTYEGVVDTVAEVGTTSNNTTNYEVVVSINSPTDIKLGMNATVNILAESKDSALVIPKEALTEQDGKKYVKVSNSSNQGAQNTESTQSSEQGQVAKSTGDTSHSGSGGTSGGRLVEVTTGIENDDYVEILSGVEEGQEVVITLPATSSSTNSNSALSNSLSKGLTGGSQGGTRPAGGQMK